MSYRSMVVLTILIMFFYGCAMNPHHGSISESNSSVFSDHIEKTSFIPSDHQTSSDVSILKTQHFTPAEQTVHQVKEEQNSSVTSTDIFPVSNDEDSINSVLQCYELSQELWRNGKIDDAIDALDHAYSQIISFVPQNNEVLDQMKEDLRMMISKRIVEIYASKNTDVPGKYKAIPIVMNKYVEEQIKILGVSKESKPESFFKQAYKRSGKYRPYIVEELRKAGLPEELSWLPLIESGFNVNALSNARALGIWQFISSTGSRFGLKRDKFIDERLDPIKSTKAAIGYLKELHTLFGDWSTAIASYNCGEHLVLNVINQQKVNYLDHFWDLYDRLPNETAQFFPRFIATLYIVSHPEEFGLNDIEVDKPIEFDTIVISKQIHLKEIAKFCGTSEQNLYELNPELRYKIVPDSSYSLRIPPNTKDIILASLDQMTEAATPSPAVIQANSIKSQDIKTIYHKVRKGETLSRIAAVYGVSDQNIIKINSKKQKTVLAGELLKIPLTKRYISKLAKNANYARTHVVRNGETLWTIAQRYGTTLKEIMKINNLTKKTLKVGQVLKIPVPVVESPKENRNYSNYSLISLENNYCYC